MSRENAERRQSISIDPRYVGRLAGTLLGICLATALLLGVVNQVTKPRIDAIQREKQEAAMAQVLPAERYEPAEAAACAVWLHGRAGDLAEEALTAYAMTPLDLLGRLPAAFKELEE